MHNFEYHDNDFLIQFIGIRVKGLFFGVSYLRVYPKSGYLL